MAPEGHSSSFTQERWSTIAGILAALLPLCCMFPAIYGGFLIWDDNVNLLSNSSLWQSAPLALRWMFTDIESVQRYKPITWLAWRVLGTLFGLNPLVFHAWNLVLHSFNSWLLFRVIRNLLLNGNEETKLFPASIPIAALFGALLWSLHPLRVEPVAWISGAGYPLATVFALLAVLVFQRQLCSNPDRFSYGALAFFALSLLSYPVACALPALLAAFILLMVPRRQKTKIPETIHRIFCLLWPYFAIAAAVIGATLVVRFTTRGDIWQRPVSLGAVGIGARLMQAGAVWGWYMEKILLPVRLSPVYPDFLNLSPTGFRSLASLFSLAAISAGTWRLRRSFPQAGILWVTFLILSIPVLGLTEIPFSPADRYSYVPDIVLTILAAIVAHRGLLCAQSLARRTTGVTLIIILTTCLATTTNQLQTWRSPVVFFRHAISVMGANPSVADLHWRLGLHYLTMGETDLAQTEFAMTIRLNPRQVDAARYLRILQQRSAHPHNTEATKTTPRPAQ